MTPPKFPQPGPPTDDPIPNRPIYGYDIESSGVDPTRESAAGKGCIHVSSVAWMDGVEIRRKLVRGLSQLPVVTHNGLGFDTFLNPWATIKADTLLMSRLLDPTRGRHSLKQLMVSRLGWQPVGEYRELFSRPRIGKRGQELKTRDPIPPEELEDSPLWPIYVDYATLALYHVFRYDLSNIPWYGDSMLDFYHRFWHPAGKLVSAIEGRGFPVNLIKLSAYREMTRHEADRAASNLARHYDGVNFNSPIQVSKLLYDVLGLPVPPIAGTKRAVHRVAVGKRPTSEAAIDWLARNHDPDLKQILDYKAASKLHQLASGLESHVRKGRIHSQLSIATETGRLASRNPNVQQIPASMRELFHASTGHRLIVADYKALEPHIMAHWMIKLFSDRSLADDLATGDVYTAASQRVYPGKPVNRDLFKQVVLSTFYLKSAGALAITLGTSRKAAETALKDFYAAYPGIKLAQEHFIRTAFETGKATTLLGRHRFLPDIKHDDEGRRKTAERQAVNTVIQGSAADVVYAAMLKAYPDRIISQVHDEIVWEVPEGQAADIATEIKPLMEDPFSGKVLALRLQVTPKIVNHWGQAK